jgi:Flp pilus assembly pilin Flp
MPSPAAVAVLLRLANRKRRMSEAGQDLLEYSILVALIALVAVGAVSTLGQTIYTVFWKVIPTNF